MVSMAEAKLPSSHRRLLQNRLEITGGGPWSGLTVCFCCTQRHRGTTKKGVGCYVAESTIKFIANVMGHRCECWIDNCMCM